MMADVHVLNSGRPMPAHKIKAGGRILVAEDDPAVRTFITRALEHSGHAVTAVEDGHQALDVLQQGTAFDLLLTDIVMPGLDGIALALKVSRDYPDLRILMVTGYAAERQRAHNLEALIHTVLPKPFTLAEIRDHVAAALTSARPSSLPSA